MAVLKPLCCIRPEAGLASKIAAGPHSSMTQEEIRIKIEKNPLSYSRIVHPKSLYQDKGMTSDESYVAAAENLEQWIREGIMHEETEEAYYLYRLEIEGHHQTGLVGCASIDDIIEQKVRAHEKIRESKLADLAHHIELCGAQIGGPILMAYRSKKELTDWMEEVSHREPDMHFFSENGVWNTIWKVADPKECLQVRGWMEDVEALYIADGHHRVMSAVRICQKMRNLHPDYTGREPWNYVATVCFPDDQLMILPYSRIVEDQNNMTGQEILTKIQRHFQVTPLEGPEEPAHRGEFVMILEDHWYRLCFKEDRRPKQVPDSLDATVLHTYLLHPILGIHNASRDNRLEFAGGSHQAEKLVERCTGAGKIGFLLYPTAMEELLEVADRGTTMPPKSTWFEPKLCNGLFIYRITEKD